VPRTALFYINMYVNICVCVENRCQQDRGRGGQQQQQVASMVSCVFLFCLRRCQVQVCRVCEIVGVNVYIVCGVVSVFIYICIYIYI